MRWEKMKAFGPCGGRVRLKDGVDESCVKVRWMTFRADGKVQICRLGKRYLATNILLTVGLKCSNGALCGEANSIVLMTPCGYHFYFTSLQIHNSPSRDYYNTCGRQVAHSILATQIPFLKKGKIFGSKMSGWEHPLSSHETMRESKYGSSSNSSIHFYRQ